ncbi:uncharacterized protein LOC124148675 [Haliotis rufescens]|uniref:uncharacterized protein LOC124148675 n=1 Tax=Haliotis rufescens TaxID=6454 RepID=UPI00201F4D97|nr:uncharacterized protein LOC124148675 [Haliotis rufescens]
MADGPSAAKKAKTDLPKCPYGSRCYRKNPQHFLDFDHPKDGEKDPKPKLPDSTSLPPCQYGAKCYRKNLLHFAEFSHPTSSGVAADAGSGSDTDVVDSDEDDKKPAPKKDGKDVLNRGMSLVKSFSQMTEAERKELIKKAFEAKQQLQKELEQTKKKVEEKEKEVKSLQDQVSTGLLLVDGEKEAMEGDQTVYFPLAAERAYKEGSAAQTHFRLAESQFYRLLTSTYTTNVRVSKVEYVVNPTLVKRFKDARQHLKKTRGEDNSYPVLAFHGTEEKNIVPICETGFRVPGSAGFSHRTDTGWYGKGVYFSEYPSYSMSYIQGATKLLLCQVLPGKVYKCTKLIHGASLAKGNDSHTSPDGKELVIFNSHHIIPCYIVHYETSSGDFTYKKAGSSGPSTSSDTADEDVTEKFSKVSGLKATSVFKGQKILFSGSFCDTQANMNTLVVKHKGGVGTVGTMTLLVASEAEFCAKSTKVKKAELKGVSIVREEFLYDCIIKKKFLDVDDYCVH